MKYFMKKLIAKRFKNEHGLTLIELLAVIVILGIIASIAVPSTGNLIQNTRDKAVLSDAVNIIAGAKFANLSGACDASITNDADPKYCDSDILNNYIDGITLGGTNNENASVVLVAGKWNINYTKFGDIINIKRSDGTTSFNATTTITEEELLSILN
ncbi:prepilin-type N-terminal cleavage/methylation domain-containing protein [Ureibacillus manganicus]|uniref:prepilin-type N-terminal cleavage/methylation domain-containing protein n=1 Tax=Ureibacillus manganicus TaxID=1266064 RepID=UPI00068DD086|nr:prepilin-type N-terminal cleavage/methylation domain-containing protein [Ureibacillus manganicus]